MIYIQSLLPQGFHDAFLSMADQLKPPRLFDQNFQGTHKPTPLQFCGPVISHSHHLKSSGILLTKHNDDEHGSLFRSPRVGRQVIPPLRGRPSNEQPRANEETAEVEIHRMKFKAAKTRRIWSMEVTQRPRHSAQPVY
ncbi:hypothetical protein BS47DRAFT_924452 [Hydnum rufescens UP504]|uniref:Uncharacterized protein n=1 Tax=Hydnum rufescens UP504 TaxID=1448309 RepID=A0A9P6E015_9AGAM|nr:hypothetical protein BS47DRAFT_924452 [Hydnum rufescens UP504]